MEKRKLYSSHVKTGSRTFFFEIRESEQKRPYLVIQEVRKKDDETERKSLVIFENDVEQFAEAFLRTLINFQGATREDIIREARKKHPNAFVKWSEDEEAKLRVLFNGGNSIADISKELGRGESAISARLKKMQLITDDVAVAA